MDKKRWYLNPSELTPAERLDRVVELLAKASFLLAVEQMKAGEGIEEVEKEDPTISAPTPLQIKSGPVPFGQKSAGLDRVEDESEAKWIKNIQKFRKAGLSTEKIAKRLNNEDKESRRAGKWTRSTVWRILKRLETNSKE